jgi:hypothetical protein
LKRLATGAALLAMIAASPALACLCLPRSEAQIIEAADVAVAGKVSDVRRIGRAGSGSLIATLEVTRIIKGRVHRQIQVRTRDNPAACGIDFQPGNLVRVAAQKLNDGLNTNLCMALAAPRA